MERDAPELDTLDRAILAVLQRDGRISIAKLADEVGLSRAATYNRVDKLETGGVITGYTVTLDHEKAGLDVAALVLISARQGSWQALRDRVAALGAVEWVGLATGPFDFVLLVRAPDLAHLRDVVLWELQSIEEVRNTQTVMLLDEFPSVLDLDPA